MIELRVLTGLHRETSLPLLGDQCHIGASDDADLALYDPEVEAEHLLISCIDEHWEITHLQGSVVDREGHELQEKKELLIGEPFRVANVWIILSDSTTPWEDNVSPPVLEKQEEVHEQDDIEEDEPPARRLNIRVFAVLSSIIALIVVTSAWALANNEKVPLPEITGEKDQPLIVKPKQVNKIIEKMLRERELHNSIQLVQQDNNFFLNGAVTKEHFQLSERMLKRFYLQHGRNVKITNNLTIEKIELPFKIVQITSGHRAHVVTDKGKRLFIGDEVDGLRLVKVSKDRIYFKGNRNIEVSW